MVGPGELLKSIVMLQSCDMSSTIRSKGVQGVAVFTAHTPPSKSHFRLNKACLFSISLLPLYCFFWDLVHILESDL